MRLLFDENGDLTHAYASGLVSKVRLPGGTLFLSAGHLDATRHPGSIFLISPDVGVTWDLDAFCGFFADP